MSEFEQPLERNESLQVSEQILESVPAHLSETQQGTLSEGPLQQEDPFEAELLQVRTDYQEACRKMADTVKPESVKEEEKALALFLGKYNTSAQERLERISRLYAESSEGFKRMLAAAGNSDGAQDLAPLRAELETAQKNLLELYRKHTENIELLLAPFEETDEEKKKLILDHYDTFLHSEMADQKTESEAAGSVILDELVRAKTVQSLLTETSMEERQDAAKNVPTDLTGIVYCLQLSLQSKTLKNDGEGQNIVTLPAFLQSDGKESPSAELDILRYKDARAGFQIFASSQRLIEFYEKEYNEAEEKRLAAYRKWKGMRDRVRWQNEHPEEADELPEDQYVADWEAEEAHEAFYAAASEYDLKESYHTYFTDAQRKWIANGDKMSKLLNAGLTRYFDRAQEEYDAIGDQKQKNTYRDNAFRKLAEISEKVGRLGRLYSTIVYDRKLKEEAEGAFDKSYDKAMARFLKLAEELNDPQQSDLAALEKNAEKLVRAASETVQFLSREKKLLFAEQEGEDLSETGLMEEMLKTADAKAKEKAYLQKDRDEAESIAHKEKTRREAEEKKKELEEREAEIRAEEEERNRAYEEEQRRVREEAERNSHILKITMANRFAEDQEMIVPKTVLGKIDAFTNAKGKHVEGVGKLRVFGERIFGMKTEKLDERIGKHVDRFLGGNGEITDGTIAETASVVAESTGLFRYANGAPEEKRIGLFKSLSETTNADEIKRIVEEAAKENLLGGNDPDELDIDDPFYEQYPNARKTIMMYRLVRGVESKVQGKEMKDLGHRLTAARNNLRKLRDQVIASPVYANYQRAAAFRTIKEKREGYRTEITKVQSQLADIRSTLQDLPPAEQYARDLEERTEAFRGRVQDGLKSSTLNDVMYEIYQKKLHSERFVRADIRELQLTEAVNSLALARENDRAERQAYLDSLHRQVGAAALDALTQDSFMEILDTELISHKAFEKKNRLFSFLRNNTDPVPGDLLREYRDKLARLVLKQMLIDQPGGVSSYADIAELSREQFIEYAGKLRERLFNLQALYTKDREEWFSNPRYTERLLQKLLAGEGGSVDDLIRLAGDLHVEVTEGDEIMKEREVVMLGGMAWDTMHVSVDMYEQQKSFAHDAVRSDSRLNRMMDADETVEGLCRALAVKKPKSYYEVLAEHLKAKPEDSALSLSGKQKIYTEYLDRWLRDTEAVVSSRTTPEVTDADALGAELARKRTLLDRQSDELRSLREEQGTKGQDLSEAKGFLPDMEAETQDSENDFLTKKRERDQAERERDVALERLHSLESAPEGESEADQALREQDKKAAEREYLKQKRKAELMAADTEGLRAYHERTKSATEAHVVRIEQLQTEIAELETRIAEKDKDRTQTIREIEQSSMRLRLAKRAEKAKKVQPKEVVEFLTANVVQSKVPLKKERSNMLEYGVYRFGARLLEGKLGKDINTLSRSEYNEALEREALKFVRCRLETEEVIDQLPGLYHSPEEKESIRENWDHLAMQCGSVEEYRLKMREKNAHILSHWSEIDHLTRRKDARLSLFRTKEYMAFLPLVPLLLKDETFTRRLLCDKDEDYRAFVNDLVQRTAPYMSLLSGTGVYNGLIDQYLRDYGAEILAVARREKDVPEKAEILRRFEATYKKLMGQDTTDTTLSKIMEEAVREVDSQEKKKKAAEKKAAKKQEPVSEVEKHGIPESDPMTICTMILVTSGPEGLRDKKRMALYRERADENIATLRSALQAFVDENVPKEEQISFLEGVRMMEKTCILQDPDIYARTLHERLRQYREYEKLGFDYAKKMKGMQEMLDLAMGTVRSEKEKGRKKLAALREENRSLKTLLAKDQTEGPEEPAFAEEVKEMMDKITALHKSLPAHGALNSFYRDMLARAAAHSIGKPKDVRKAMNRDYMILVNMLTMDTAVSAYAQELRGKKISMNRDEEEMFRTGVYELMADFATSGEKAFSKEEILEMLRSYFSEEKGGRERLRVIIHDRGDYYGIGNTLSGMEENGSDENANAAAFERAIRWRPNSSVKVYKLLGPEEKNLVAQIIANDHLAVKKRTPAQRRYANALKASELPEDIEARKSSYVYAMCEGYLTGMEKVAPPNYAVVMAVLKRSIGMRMEVFDRAVRLVQNLKDLKARSLPLQANTLAILMG